MNVTELIRILKQMPQDALVVAEGYEDGYDSIKKVSLVSVEENPEKEWYLGHFIQSNKENAMKVVFINAENKADKK